MNKKVFIIADIGFGEDRAIHVGDEAMFYSNLKHLKNLGFKIYASSRSISHDNDFEESLDIYVKNIVHYIWLILLFYIRNFLKINFFNKSFSNTIDNLIDSDLLFVSGGGNLTSLWPGHIYYRSLMIHIANRLGKRIFVSGQTIGPDFKRHHKFVLKPELKKADIICVRDTHFSKNILIKEMGLDNSIVKEVSDDTFCLYKSEKKKEIKKIGVSLHDWGLGEDDKNEIIKQLKIIADKDIEFVFIPHYYDSLGNYDIKFFKEIIKCPSELNDSIDMVDYSLLSKKTVEQQVDYIKDLYKEVDMVIGSRYHSLVFGLTHNIPVISINADKYYSIKNFGLLEKHGRYVNQMCPKKNSDISSSFLYIKDNYANFQDYIVDKNKFMVSAKNILKDYLDKTWN